MASDIGLALRPAHRRPHGMAGGQKLQDDMDADEARPAGDQNSAHDPLSLRLEILFALMNGAVRFGALRRSIGGITQHMLTTQLRELEQDGLVSRTVFAEKPLRVEYELTDAAYACCRRLRKY
ncbi:hypothetical protein ABIA45_000610 [Bradyrhizobium sp. USDA 336]